MAHGDRTESGKWLRERRLAQEPQVPHMRRWVSRFLQPRSTRSRERWQDTLSVYLEELGDGRYAPWQVRHNQRRLLEPLGYLSPAEY